MLNRTRQIILYFLILTLASCAGNNIQDSCMIIDNEIAASDRTKLTEWDTVTSDDNSEEFNQPKELLGGGTIEMGASGNKLGAPGSRATKSFNCGEGKKCSIHVYTGVFDGNEKLQITVKNGNQTLFNESVDNVLFQPKKIVVPTCKGLTITLKMTGSQTGFASKHRVVVHTKCLDC